MAQQLTLNLPHRAARGRDDFWVSDSNAQAVALIDAWPGWLGSAVIVTGPRGAGKSHLAQVWRDMSAAHLISADELDIATVPELMSAGALVVEDADRHAFDERALFHLLNFAREIGGYVLLTARRAPSFWGVKLPDLQSRLVAAQPAEIAEPDDVLLRAVLVKLFADRQLKVDEAVISYLVTRMERSLGRAHDLVDELDRRALSDQRAITRTLAASLFKA